MPDQSSEKDLRLAVLIDADNASRTAMKDVMAEVAVYGTPTIKRIYGDWTSPNMSTWKSILLETAITPIQQYSYTTGKNATDSAMIIDAMDILYSGNCDGFVLVSSDSDFTRLATRLREAGMKVYGMGEKKTPKPFIVACDKFVYIEVIRAAAQQAAQQEKESVPQKSSKKSSKKAAQQAVSAPAASAVPQDMVELIADSLENLCDEDGYTLMGKLSNLLMKKQPDFDPRNYGFSKLSKMIKSLDRFEVDVRQVGDNNTDIYVRDKQGKDKLKALCSQIPLVFSPRLWYIIFSPGIWRRRWRGGVPMADSVKVVAKNSKAYHDYFIEDKYEAGIELAGTEVKSIRLGHVNLKDSFCVVKDGEMSVIGMHISPYEKGNIFNKDPMRQRRLLMHKREILRLFARIKQDGYSLIPLSIYFRGPRVKLELGLAKGKKLYDKRDSAAARDAKREMDRAIKSRNR